MYYSFVILIFIGIVTTHEINVSTNYSTNDNIDNKMIDSWYTNYIISKKQKLKQQEIEQYLYNLIDKNLINIPKKNKTRFSRFDPYCNLTNDGNILLTDKFDKYYCQIKPSNTDSISLKFRDKSYYSPVIDLIFTFNELSVIGESPRFQIWTNKYSNFFYSFDFYDLNYMTLQPILTYGATIKFLIPGWKGKHDIKWIIETKNNIFDKYNNNCYVIVYDWYYISQSMNYFFVADKVKGYISTYLAKFMVRLVDDGGIYSKHIHIIGFSLGAHVAGCSAYKFKKLSSYQVKIGHITGLDPAGPSFEDEIKRNRLSSDDAYFVECIHTCISILGFTNPVGDVDYYSDGGFCYQQSMCKNEDFLNNYICGHYSAVAIYNSVLKNNESFEARKCSSWTKFENGKCDDNHVLWVGETDIEERYYGTYVFRSDYLSPELGIYSSMFGGIDFQAELTAWSSLVTRRVYTWR